MDLKSKSMDRFLYDRDFRHERVNVLLIFHQHPEVALRVPENMEVKYDILTTQTNSN